MRVTVSHSKDPKEVARRIDEAANELLNSSGGPMKVRNVRKSWTGSKMHVSFTASIGVISQDLSGSAEVTPTEVIVEFELPGLLGRLMPADKVEKSVKDGVRGLLT